MKVQIPITPNIRSYIHLPHNLLTRQERGIRQNRQAEFTFAPIQGISDVVTLSNSAGEYKLAFNCFEVTTNNYLQEEVSYVINLRTYNKVLNWYTSMRL